MKPVPDKRFTFMLTNRLYWSKAYQALSPAAKNLMWCIYSELKFTGSRKKKNFSYTNNGKVSFTEREFKANKLGASATYIRARNELIEVGLIKVTYRGGMARGDMNKYKLLWIEGVRESECRWKRYPQENWKHEIPKVKDYAVGKKTRFKKKNNTLKNNTLNGTNLPNGLESSNETSLSDKGVTDDF